MVRLFPHQFVFFIEFVLNFSLLKTRGKLCFCRNINRNLLSFHLKESDFLGEGKSCTATISCKYQSDEVTIVNIIPTTRKTHCSLT